MVNILLIAATAALMDPAQAAAPQGAQASLSNGCEDAAVRVNTSVLPRTGSAQWNDWVVLTGCGARGATVIAGALRSDAIRTESELSRLDYMTGLLDGWFQPQLVTAYQWILRSPDASNAMRLRAMWLLSGLYAPDIDVAGPLQGYMSARCETYDRNTTLREAPERLPESAYEEARSAVMFAADDRSAPEYVRTTARCWENIIANELKQGTVVEEPENRAVVVNNPTTIVVERPIRIAYDCDNRFVIYNDLDYDLAVRYSGYGSGGTLRVTRGGPFVWVAGRFGPVRFWVGDTEVFYPTAVYRSCHSYGHRVVVAAPVHIWTGWHVGLGVWIRTPVVRTVRWIVPRYRVHRPVIHVTRPVIVGPGRRNDDWDRGRSDRDRYDRDRNDRGRNDGRRDDDRFGTRRNDERGDNRNDGRTYGYGNDNYAGRGRNERANDDRGRDGRTNDGPRVTPGGTVGTRNDGGRNDGSRNEGPRPQGNGNAGGNRDYGDYRGAARPEIVRQEAREVKPAPRAEQPRVEQPRREQPKQDAPREAKPRGGDKSEERGNNGRGRRGS